MNKTYCLSDLHGHYQILLDMLEKIRFDDSDVLYILGDCNDRGGKSFEIYEFLTQHKANIHLLKGNHELMMRDYMIKGNWECPDGRLWGHNGGKKTMEQLRQFLIAKYGEENIEERYAEAQQELIALVNSCPSYVELNMNGTDYVLIHSGINPMKSLYEQDEEECAWMRDFFYMSPAIKDKVIIFGHTPTCHIQGGDNFNIWKDPIYMDKIGIDGGLGGFEKGQLNCLCLNDMSVTVIKKSECAVTDE